MHLPILLGHILNIFEPEPLCIRLVFFPDVVTNFISQTVPGLFCCKLVMEIELNWDEYSGFGTRRASLIETKRKQGVNPITIFSYFSPYLFTPAMEHNNRIAKFCNVD
ncbi:hypothetical protein AB833_03225 [Chromatiales bacterium (ex Bugula neritina AB1)]|nr:hypothetical protein AB833_03225 [Chromatiales bacterium (ex Bugula neritina AB1)]